ncbi:hypothetical protein M1E08_06630 [Erwinia sp. PK3-005]|uniref:Uncharacterized protein n=1 Tax=Mixta hanseatica TaxID=2872648 RepID=A0ABY4R5W3_9GAMM|nr:hypothetical protein [Mixta hanseatica]UQY42957.1 hypothetical protein K6958_13690 [Mixta hanseatica]
MAAVKAKNVQDTEALLHSGVNKVELDWEIDSDDFFHLASHWCARGAKITRSRQHFVLSVKGFAIPPND